MSIGPESRVVLRIPGAGKVVIEGPEDLTRHGIHMSQEAVKRNWGSNPKAEQQKMMPSTNNQPFKGSITF